ncbi:MAG: hypothetical protein DRP46_08025 [Candidatus Zixiibacteriota bacterium]|nr:MAG: hypothetical protein DRP46_08025 [candidate division Zixibacteria bacterium]
MMLEHEKRSRQPHKPTKGEKKYWYPYSLQALSPKRFAAVTAMILNGRYELISLRRADTVIQYNQAH